MRGFGHSVRKLRHVADDLQRQFEQAMPEGKIEDVRGAMQGMRTPNDPPLLPIPADPAEPRRASKPASLPRPSRARVGPTAAPRGRTSKSIRRKQRRTIAAK
jgi:hypothetical protein